LRSTRSLRLRCLGLALLAVAATAVADINAPPLAPSILSLMPGVKLRGGGELTMLGLSIYDGYYWSHTDGWSPDQPFALELVYHRRLPGAKIAERSVEEMAKLGYGSSRERESWCEQMKRIFPDVDDGDRLTGVNLPREGVRFFRNGAPIGSIEDRDFARAFFAIWLDPRTSEPALRKKLLGEQ
jgi:hypothetical protein